MIWADDKPCAPQFNLVGEVSKSMAASGVLVLCRLHDSILNPVLLMHTAATTTLPSDVQDGADIIAVRLARLPETSH